ncbi:MAG: NCS2 family permease [Candidatus Delongbacteria bacterium]|nr:NCS2 family permease [Candidatus Delongbacteria bacterium]
MMKRIRDYFQLEHHQTSIRQEVIAGATTFITMAYIIIVNPKILEAAGMPFEASMVATILSAVFGTLIMGIFAKRPFAIAPYMGENAFMAYTVVGVLGYPWQTAIGAIFVGGVVFTLITILRLRKWMANAIPEALKIGFAVGIGLFLTFIGLNETGIIRLGVPGAPVRVGDFHQTSVQLAILGFILIGVLMLKKIRGAILIGILTVTFLSFVLGVTPLPQTWFSLPPDISPILFKLDIAGVFTWGFFAVILTVFMMDFLDTLGTLIGLAYRANLLDEKGNLPGIEKPMLADSLATMAGALLGTTTTGTYIESATGIEAGGRTGLTAVVTAFFFLSALFFAPFFVAIPAFAYGPSLIIVGLVMMSPITRLNFNDLSDAIPVFIIIILMSFSYNLGIGMTAGFVLYPIFKIVAGKIREIKPALWILSLMSLLFFVFYPY